MANFKYLISVMTPDRVGLMRDIAQTVVDTHGDITDIRQSIVSGFFSLIFVTEHEEDSGTPLHDALRAVLPKGAALSIMTNPQKLVQAEPDNGPRYIAICSGKDRRGLILEIADFMSSHEMNIENCSTTFDGDHVTHVFTVCFRTAAYDLKAIQAAYKQRMADFGGFTAQLCHEDIFRATGEITPIKSFTLE